MYRFILKLVLICLSFSAASNTIISFDGNDNPGNKKKLLINSADNTLYHPDDIHRLNFIYPDRHRGIKPYIAPTILIITGTAIHFMTGAKESFRDFMQINFSYSSRFYDYFQYAPLAAVYILNVIRVNGKNNFGNRTAIAIKSFLLNGLITYQLKHWTNVKRPDGKNYSFPSGHTSKAFMFAHFMHKEYGEMSPWFSVSAYACASTVGILRTAKDTHWISDVVAGAGIGILSTELIYLTHQYKWDNEHLKQWVILPFQLGKQKGVTLVYNF
jgi:membrane-associated phospholipid phosphatase